MDELKTVMRANAVVLDGIAETLRKAIGIVPLTADEMATLSDLEALALAGTDSPEQLAAYQALCRRDQSADALAVVVAARLAEIRDVLGCDGNIFDAIERAIEDAQEQQAQIEALMSAAKAVTGSDEDDPEQMAALLRGSIDGIREREAAEADAWAERQARLDAEAMVRRLRERAPVRDGDPELAVYTIERAHAYCQDLGFTRIRETNTYEFGQQGRRAKLNYGGAEAVNSIAAALGISAWDVLDDLARMP